MSWKLQQVGVKLGKSLIPTNLMTAEVLEAYAIPFPSWITNITTDICPRRTSYPTGSEKDGVPPSTRQRILAHKDQLYKLWKVPPEDFT